MGESKRRKHKAPTMDGLIDRSFQRARERLVLGEREEPLHPTWCFVMQDGRVVERETPFEGTPIDPLGDMAKETTARATRSWMLRNGVMAYCFASEAWTIQNPDPDDPGLPRHHPARIEIVAAYAENANGDCLFATWKMIRGETGRCVYLRAELLNADERRGRFMGLLKKRPARWWTADNDPRTTFFIEADELEQLEREGPPDDETRAKIAELEPTPGSTERNMRRVFAAYHDLVERMQSHAYRCGCCGEDGKFNAGDRPRHVAFVYPWPDPELNSVVMAPVCEPCGVGSKPSDSFSRPPSEA
jgi:hypothetical protein